MVVVETATKSSCFAHFWQGAQSLAPATRNVWTSKSGPRPSVFNTFDLEMCFAPQRRALFRHRATSKSGLTMVCCNTFDFEICFAPQRRAIFHLSSGQMASRLPLELAYFSTLRSHKSLEKNTVFRNFPTFSRTCIFFLLTISLPWSSFFCSSLPWLLAPLLFHLSILPEVWLLNFLR